MSQEIDERPAVRVRRKPWGTAWWVCGVGGLTLAFLAAHARPRPGGPLAASSSPIENPTESASSIALSPLLMAQLDRDLPVLPPYPAPEPQPFVGPPVPVPLGAASASRLGHLGPMGPVTGPLNTGLENGPVLGPQWERKPLPNVAMGPPAPPGKGIQPGGRPAVSDISSELPDARTVALSRLAHPELEVRKSDGPKSGTVTAENPLALHVSVGRGKQELRVGESVAAHVTASADCYAALVLVDSTGKATTLFHTPNPTRSFSVLLKAGPNPGSEFLLAVGSIHPLNGSELAAALSGAGTFPVAAGAPEGGVQPAVAWSAAVSQAGALPASSQHPKRFEWADATAAFAVHAPLVASKPGGPQRPVATGRAESHPVISPRPQVEPKPETSVLPGAEPAPSKSSMPKGSEPGGADESGSPPGSAQVAPGDAEGPPSAAVKSAVAKAPVATRTSTRRKRRRSRR